MKFKKPSKRALVIVIFMAIVFALSVVIFFAFGNSNQINLFLSNQEKSNLIYNETVSPLLLDAIKGSRLKIPVINVDSFIEPVGLTYDGSKMGVPKGPDNVGWYNLGSYPGENGNAVLDGHSGWRNGIPAVFDNLNKLKQGDKIYVEDKKGTTTTFIVRELKTYEKDERVPDVFFSNDGKPHLNLITCAGTWNIFWKSHSERLVVFALKE